MTPNRLRRIVIGFAFAATVINYVNRQTPSVFAPSLLRGWSISDREYGWIVSAFLGLERTFAFGSCVFSSVKASGWPTESSPLGPSLPVDEVRIRAVWISHGFPRNHVL